MEFDPETHHRRSSRLRGYDYSLPGAYFVTLCTYGKRHLFGEVVEGEMRRSQFGNLVELYWRDLPRRYPELRADAFVVMPNHIHGVLMVGAIHESPTHGNLAAGAIPELPLRQQRRGMRLSKIVGRFKMTAAKHINEIRATPGGAVWQRNYFERIVRNPQELEMIREYIHTNPSRWDTDPERW